MKTLILAALSALPALGQVASIGVKAGVPLVDADSPPLYTPFANAARRYLLADNSSYLPTRISPEVRYTHWQTSSFQWSNPNQADVMLGLAF